MNTQTTATEPIIRVEGLVRLYGLKPSMWAMTRQAYQQGTPTANNPGFKAVDGISFHVNPGEVFGLLGTNGAGKTTTLEMLEGLSRPHSGKVTLFGKDPVKDRNKIRPLTGIMLQHGGLPKELTVKETLTMWAGTCSNPMPIDQAMNDVELTHRANNKVGGLSGGEQRRLDLACALLNNPKLLFLDEPTTGLDPESRQNTWDLLATLKRKGVTMVLTTHYLEEAEHLCDRIAIMHKGSIALEGTLGELVASQPAEISFHSPQGLGGEVFDRSTLPALPEELTGAHLVDGSGTDAVIRISSSDLQNDSLRVLSWANQHNLVLPHFTATPASLESVFMSIAGRKV